MATTLTLPKWYDLHTHFRQGANVRHYIADHLAMGCAGALAMPNTQPPVALVTGPDTASAWSIESYRDILLQAGADTFDQLIVPLYLTRDTTPRMIEQGASSGLLRACKYYPPHGTTNSEHGVPMDEWIGGDVFKAMEAHGIVLCIHGEQHALSGSNYFDENQTAESTFYTRSLPRILDAHPDLKIVCEHITTKTAADFVSSAPDHVGATITPQHLLYTVGHLIQGLKYHLYCLPVVKFEKDRDALRSAVSNAGQSKFFAGTDSAPHTNKATECGCAAGCYTGGCAPQLYAMALEEAGLDLESETGRKAFESFLCTNGPAFYGFPTSAESFALMREPSTTAVLKTEEGPVTPLPSGMGLEMHWAIA
ncbi:MAG: amidohydrolase family protein [Verrucomicrobiales bacterium]|nr:amidohydrolase family protein [Verrucomicrobiales bacterium]